MYPAFVWIKVSDRDGALHVDLLDRTLRQLLPGGAGHESPEDALLTFVSTNCPKLDTYLEGARALGERSLFLCYQASHATQPQPPSGRWLPLPGPDTDFGLASEALPYWQGAVEADRSGEVVSTLSRVLCRRYAGGELGQKLEELDPDKASDDEWPNARAIDSEAWAELSAPSESVPGLRVLGSAVPPFEVAEYVLEGAQGATEGLRLLAFRTATLFRGTPRALSLAYRCRGFRYEDEDFRSRSKQLLTKSPFLSVRHVVQRLCTFHVALFDEIITYCEDKAVSTVRAKGCSHVSDALVAYYVPDGSHHASVWLPAYLRAFANTDELSVSKLQSLRDLTADQEGRLSALAPLEKGTESKNGDLHDFVEQLAAERGWVPEVAQGKTVMTCDYSMGKVIAAVAIEDIPEARGVSYPLLRVRDIKPLFLRRRIVASASAEADVPLGDEFRRHAVCAADVRMFTAQLLGGVQVSFGLADFRHSLSPEEARHTLPIVVHRRLTQSERRLFRLLGLPGRESLEDMEAAGVSNWFSSKPPKEVATRSAEVYDEALGNNVERLLALRDELNKKASQEEVGDLLAGPIEPVLRCADGALAALPALEVLARLLEFPHVEDKRVVRWLKEQKQALHARGALLLLQVAEWVQESLQEGGSTDSATSDPFGPLRLKLWLELQTAFPDDATWPRTERAGRTDQPVSAFAAAVLSCLYHRPDLRDCDYPSELPKRELAMVLASARRINMFSAVFPLCCGDWCCSYYFDSVEKMRTVEKSRIFAASIPGRQQSPTAGWVDRLVPDECIATGTNWCTGARCRHAQNGRVLPRHALWMLAKKWGRVEELTESLRVSGFWLNTALDSSAHHHYRCRLCESLLVVDPDSHASKPHFSCPRLSQSEGHDRGVYINWCLGTGCSAVIDSRESAHRCSHGGYICVKCRCCCFRHLKPADPGGNAACYACRRELRGPKRNASADYDEVTCDCGALNHVYSREQRAVTDDCAAVWQENMKGLRYNTREVSDGAA